MEHEETALMLKGYGLTTAEFYYRMPDFRHVLNSFVWQDYDLAPDYPRLFDYLRYRETKGMMREAAAAIAQARSASGVSQCARKN